MRLAKTDQYWFEVEFRIQEEDGISTASCELLFRRMTRSQAQDVFEDKAGDTGISRSVVVKWRNFKDVDGQSVDWSDELFEEAISHPAIAAEIVRAWARSLSAIPKKG